MLELGRAEHSAKGDESVFLRILTSPTEAHLDGVNTEQFGAAVQQIRRAQAQLLRSAAATSVDVRLEAIRHELQLTADLLLLAAKIGRATWGSAGERKGVDSLAPTTKTDIANK